jgi:hypothetical protein
MGNDVRVVETGKLIASVWFTQGDPNVPMSGEVTVPVLRRKGDEFYLDTLMFVEGVGWVDHKNHEELVDDVAAYTNNTWEQVALALGIERKQVLARKALEE